MEAPGTTLRPALIEAIRREVASQGFGDAEERWLTLVLQGDSTLPVPVAAAMVRRVRELPIGAELTALFSTLQRLKALTNPELTTSERRVTEALVRSVIAEAESLLIATTTIHTQGGAW
jgi:hypothetical protein